MCTLAQTHVIQCQPGLKGDELSWLSLSLMWPMSFTLSGHSHRLVRAKVMPDSFSHTSSRIDWACLAQSNHVNLLVVTTFIEKICDIAGEKEWMTKWGQDGESRRQENAFNKQTNEWVSCTVMRCFIDATGKPLFACSYPKGGQICCTAAFLEQVRFQCFVCWHFSRIRGLQTEGQFL